MEDRKHAHRSRRELLAMGAGAVSAATLVASGPAEATPAMLTEAIRNVVGEAPVRQGKVKLDLPPIVENGNAVSLTVTVESPMTPADHVKAIHIFNEKNPQPNVAAFHLGPRAGRASVSTRIRLADTQKVVAIAELSDGSFWSDSVNAVVTLAACVEE